MRDYTKIQAWQKADDLTVAVYEETKVFPKDEVYALTSQLRRAAYSVPANITEDASRSSQKDYLHYPHAGLLLPNTNAVAARVIVLPTGTAVEPEAIKTIVQIIRSAADAAQRVRLVLQ